MCRNKYNVNTLILSIILSSISIPMSCALDPKINASENFENEESHLPQYGEIDSKKDESVKNQDLVLPNDKEDCVKHKFKESPQLLVKTMYPGFTPGGVNGELDRVVILTSGQVMQGHRDSDHAPWREQIVGEMNASDLVNLKAKLCSLMAGKIKFTDDSPVTDGPSTHYEAQNSEGKMLTFTEYSGGRWGKLEGFQWAEELRMLVDSFK
jgi:hypothetical protein